MLYLRDLLSRIRLWPVWHSWRSWRVLRRLPLATMSDSPVYLAMSRPILRDVTPHGVRVYSLCGSCGAQLSASATLCDACARSRSFPNS
jgi:hypothetical protein